LLGTIHFNGVPIMVPHTLIRTAKPNLLGGDVAILQRNHGSGCRGLVDL
jgi:hypothetical protein